MKALEERIQILRPIEIAFMTKGLTHLKPFYNEVNKEFELKIRTQVKQYCLANSDKFDPYSFSKVLRYLFTFNDGNKESIQVFTKLAQHFLTDLRERRSSLINSKFDDPLIDIEPKDMIDIARVYSTYIP